MEYFNQLLTSYSLLKQRKLKITSRIVEQGAGEDPAARAKAMDVVKTAMGMQPGNQTINNVPVGQNAKGGAIVAWKSGERSKNPGTIFLTGLTGRSAITIGLPGGQAGPDFENLVSYFSGDEEGAEGGAAVQPDPKEEIKESLNKLDPNLFSQIQKICEKLTGFLSNDFFKGDYHWNQKDPDTGELKVKSLDYHCISHHPGSISQNIEDALTGRSRDPSLKGLLVQDVVKDAPLLQKDPNGAEKVTQALTTLNKIMELAGKPEWDDTDYEFFNETLIVDTSDGESSRLFIKSLDDNYGICFDKTLTSPLGAFGEELSLKLDEAHKPLPIRELKVANFSQNRGSLNNVKKETTEELFEILAMISGGKGEQAANKFIGLRKKYGQHLEAAFELDRYNDEIGLSDEAAEELHQFLEELKTVGGEDPDEITRNLFNRIFGIYGGYINRCTNPSMKGAQGKDRNLVNARVRVGGKVGREEQADILEMADNRTNLETCLKANGVKTQRRRSELIEERSLEDILNTELTTKAETDKGMTAEKKLKALQKEGVIPKEWSIDTPVYTSRLGIKVYQREEDDRKFGQTGSIRTATADIRKDNEFNAKIRAKLNISNEDTLFDSNAERLEGGLKTLHDLLGKAMKKRQLSTDFGATTPRELQHMVFSVIQDESIKNSTFSNLVNERLLGRVIKDAKNQVAKGGKVTALEVLQSHLEGAYTSAFFHDKINEKEVGDKLSADAVSHRKLLSALVLGTGWSLKSTNTLDGSISTGQSSLINADDFFDKNLLPFIRGEEDLEKSRGTGTFKFKGGVNFRIERSGKEKIFTVNGTQKGLENAAYVSTIPSQQEESIESLARVFFTTQRKLFEILELS